MTVTVSHPDPVLAAAVQRLRDTALPHPSNKQKMMMLGHLVLLIDLVPAAAQRLWETVLLDPSNKQKTRMLGLQHRKLS